MRPLPLPHRGLYLVTREQDPDDILVQSVRLALRGGAAAVQLRDKCAGARARRAALLRGLCHEFAVPLIINDDVELARQIGADGVHLGRDDRAIGAARRVLQPGAIVGASCYDSVARAEAAAAQGADYVAFGRFFASRTKPLASPAGLDTLRTARARLTIPIAAIGGITAANGAALVEAGAELLAVVEAVFGAADPEAAARGFESLFAR